MLEERFNNQIIYTFGVQSTKLQIEFHLEIWHELQDLKLASSIKQRFQSSPRVLIVYA